MAIQSATLEDISAKEKINAEKDLGQLFNDYADQCDYMKKLRPETIRGYRATFHIFSVLMPEIQMPDELTVGVMDEFFRRLQCRTRIVGKGTEKTGVRASTIKTYWSKLNSFFEWLMVRGKIQKNPLSIVKVAEPEYNDKRALKKEEIDKILSAIVTYSKTSFILRRDVAITSILRFTGLRKGELLGLQTKDIDMEKRILTVRAETSKSKRSRSLPIHHTLLKHLREYIEERKRKGYKTEYLIASDNDDTRLTVHGLKHWVKRLNKLSGVKFHPHQFRHTFACNLARLGVEVYRLQILMGHTDLRMTQRYLRSLGVEDCRSIIEELDVDGLV